MGENTRKGLKDVMDSLSLLQEGFKICFQADTFFYLVFGVMLGIIGGALPGFASSNTIALMLPLTFIIPAEAALVFCAGVYCGCMYGDAIPAVLFNIPGTPGAGATAFDGYPLAQKGKADIALGVSVGASVCGGLMAAILAIFLTPLMATYALKFGPAELFLLTMVAIVIVSSIAKDKRKGIITGLFGLIFATISACPAYAHPRMTFGFFELFDEIPLVSVMIGMFAIPTIIDLAFKDRVIEGDYAKGMKKIGSFSNQLEGVKEAFKRPVDIVRSALIGFFVGAIPGTGSSVATYVSYGQAKMWNKDSDSFGTGNPSGIVASEAANNAVSAGALIPTLTLGIPGSGATAMMLVVLIIHGIAPGPSLIRDYAVPVYTVLAGTLIAPIVMGPLGILFNRFSSTMTALKSSYLLTILIILCLIGSYAVRLYVFDIYMALFFGLIGLLMRKYGYPIIPFVLGIILGPIAEKNLFRVFRLSGGSFNIFTSGTSYVLLAILFVLIIAYYIYPLFKKKSLA